MRPGIPIVALLAAGCSATGTPQVQSEAVDRGHEHGHGLQGPVEVKTPPLVRMVEFHGHLGPYVVLGHRAGEVARALLGSPGYFDLEAEVTSPLHTPQSCFIDGVQLGSGCTVGKRNLVVKEGEPIAAVFRSKGGKAGPDTASDTVPHPMTTTAPNTAPRTVRIELRADLPARIASWIEKEGVEATAHRVLSMPREEVFDVR